MTTIFITSVILISLFAFLAKRSAIIAARREAEIARLESEISKFRYRLDYLRDSLSLDRSFRIVESPYSSCSCDLVMDIAISGHWSEPKSILCIDRCLIKSFYDSDPGFARRQAEELLDKLNEK